MPEWLIRNSLVHCNPQDPEQISFMCLKSAEVSYLPSNVNRGLLGITAWSTRQGVLNIRVEHHAHFMRHYSIFLLLLLAFPELSFAQRGAVRSVYSLKAEWVSMASDDEMDGEGFENPSYPTEEWKLVNVPHNWDRYDGYRRLRHGNRHGYAWYRKTFRIKDLPIQKRYFLFFEGVGSYATVFLNGEKVGAHAGGRTSFTIDVTDQMDLQGDNLLAVRADHPAFIEDLPWVCGGCSSEYGFSEGSQPMGIFRPVHLVVTDPVRVEPFGVHVWNDTTVTAQEATVHIATTLKNYGSKQAQIVVNHLLKDADGVVVTQVSAPLQLAPDELKKIELQPPVFGEVQLWSTTSPYLYTLTTEIHENGQLIDMVETPYGIRWIKWHSGADGTRQFYLNGQPVFINGTAEYEHNMGLSHAFTAEMVASRVSQIRSAGFNAFRDAHQPHNFRYQHGWDSLGVLWWTQMAAHIWYDTPEFRKNFKQLLREWVKERRNSPSVILWGLENESTLPTDFAQECTQIIREMDPTSPTQRLVTTCNGGAGTDWDVPQNWTGTYGGNPGRYGQDVVRQQLVGEYGAWRTLDWHTEGGFDQKGVLSEDRMTLLMEQKIRLADSIKVQTCGHFQWIFTSHENPGRNQSGEAFRGLDRVGPVNYKGLLSPWGEPTDAFYMYRANYAPKETEPMVYLVSHTWPNRWTAPGLKDSVVVYSNCEEVELFNHGESLGRQMHPGFGHHFQWDRVHVETNLITALGYVNGRVVAQDQAIFHHLPEDPSLTERADREVRLANETHRNYLYRVNCGGPEYVDSNGNVWSADVHRTSEDRWGSSSWTDGFEGLPAFYASERRTFDPIGNTPDEKLFQTFRYGMDQLRFHFPVPDGSYDVELHFIEPWYGTGGGLDCTNWRNFDVAINEEVVLRDVDVWKEVGHDQALIKRVESRVTGGVLTIHFPQIKSGQAIISAISISSADKKLQAASSPEPLIQFTNGTRKAWLDWGDQAFADRDWAFQYLPPELFGTDWIQTNVDAWPDTLLLELSDEADVYVAFPKGEHVPEWLHTYDALGYQVVLAGAEKSDYELYRKRMAAGLRCAFDPPDQKELAYLVFVKAVDRLEPPYDLKRKVPYDEDVAILQTDGLIVEKKMGLGCVTLTGNEVQKVSWPISTGVADYHAIHFKYSNETGEQLGSKVHLMAADGTLMQSSPVIFSETPVGKYREITIFTESMINAGAYHVQLVSVGAKGLSIRGIRVQ